MKPLPLLRYVPKPLRLARIFHPARPRESFVAYSERGRLRYIPLMYGSQGLPYLYREDDRFRGRDPYGD